MPREREGLRRCTKRRDKSQELTEKFYQRMKESKKNPRVGTGEYSESCKSSRGRRVFNHARFYKKKEV